MINWKEIPFVKFLLPLVIGILLSIILENAHFIWYGILMVAVCIRIVLLFYQLPYAYRYFHGFLAYTIIFLIGYLWCFHFNDLQKEHHFKHQLADKNIIVGKVKSSPVVGRYLKLTLSTQFIGSHPDSLNHCLGNILVYLKNDSTTQVNYGDIVIFKGQIQAVPAPQNPYAFDYKNYLKFKNIHFQTFVHQSNLWQKTTLNQGNFIQKKALKIRQYFLSILEKHLLSSRELAVGNALILGYKEGIDEEVRTAYAHTGALHVLAVSGLHVGLIAWFVNILLSLIKQRNSAWRFTKMFILIFVTWSFALISGGSPSVLRAATMFTFLIIGLSVNRTSNIYNSLAISACVLLIWNPYLLVNVSFQLSYIAIISIVYFHPKIFRALIIKNRFYRSIWNLIALSLAAQIGTLPISIYYFHSVPLLAWLSGIVVIPAATIILGSGILLLTLESILPTFAFLAGWILYYSIWIMNEIIFFIQNIPFGVWEGVWIGIETVILLYLIIGNIALAISTKQLKWLLPASCIFLIVTLVHTHNSLKEYTQRKLMIYHSNRHSIIDFFDGKNAVSLHSKNISEKELSFSTQNNRWAHGIKNVHNIYFENINFQTKNIFYQKPFIQFFTKTITIIDPSFQPRAGIKMKVDFILLQKNPGYTIEEISQYFSFEKIIFSTYNSSWKIEEWKKDCQTSNIPYHDISTQGAFVIALE